MCTTDSVWIQLQKPELKPYWPFILVIYSLLRVHFVIFLIPKITKMSSSKYLILSRSSTLLSLDKMFSGNFSQSIRQQSGKIKMLYNIESSPNFVSHKFPGHQQIVLLDFIHFLENRPIQRLCFLHWSFGGSWIKQ